MSSQDHLIIRNLLVLLIDLANLYLINCILFSTSNRRTLCFFDYCIVSLGHIIIILYIIRLCSHILLWWLIWSHRIMGWLWCPACCSFIYLLSEYDEIIWNNLTILFIEFKEWDAHSILFWTDNLIINDHCMSNRLHLHGSIEIMLLIFEH